MINLYKTNNKLITNTYINLDYIKSEERLDSVFVNSTILTNIENPLLFVNDLREYELDNTSGVRKDRCVNYGVLLTFMINNPKVKDSKLLALTKEIIKEFKLSNYPYYCFIKRYKKSLYLVVYICERRYYKTPKLIQVKAKQTRYKNNKGCYCKSSDKGAKLIYKEGDIIRSYYSKFSSKTQRFRFANPHQFSYTMNKYKLLFIDLCVKCLNEQVRNTITFKRCGLKQLDFREKSIARIWTKSYEKMEKEFYNAYMSMSFGEEEAIESKTKQKINSLFQNYNEIIINNYQRREDDKLILKHFYTEHDTRKKHGVSLNFNVSLKEAKGDAKAVLEAFKESLYSIVQSYMYDKTILVN